MIIDKLYEFADATALDTSGTGYQLIGTGKDINVARDIGVSDNLYLVIQVTTAVDSSGDGASVQFILASDASASIAVDGNASEHLHSPAIPEATLVAKKQYVFQLPPEGTPYERYIGLIANVTGEAVTAGAINAFITSNPAVWQGYPDATN